MFPYEARRKEPQKTIKKEDLLKAMEKRGTRCPLCNSMDIDLVQYVYNGMILIDDTKEVLVKCKKDGHIILVMWLDEEEFKLVGEGFGEEEKSKEGS